METRRGNGGEMYQKLFFTVGSIHKEGKRKKLF